MLSRADLVVSAVPDPNYRIPVDYVKDGAAVVAVNPGNVDESQLAEKCSLLSSNAQPIGRLTRMLVLDNLCRLARQTGNV
jgi:5,10-methylene-tetrahydrofolate dehydrogenase/methenyl tetrahydrofolate cyclohydrolase